MIGRCPTNRNAPFDGSASRTPRPDWSVPDQSERFVSPTNQKAPFDGSKELRAPIGRFPTNRNASLARPIGRFLLTAPKNSASRLVGSRPIGTTLRSAARPIGRFLLTASKNSASRLVGSRPIGTLRAKKQTHTHTHTHTDRHT